MCLENNLQLLNLAFIRLEELYSLRRVLSLLHDKVD